MDGSKLLKVGAVAGAGYAGWKYVDEKYAVSADLQLARKLLKLKNTGAKARAEGKCFSDFWYDTVGKYSQKNCILYEDTVLTFADVERLSSKVSNWLLNLGVKKGDTIALLMENRPEFIIYELGITKIGAAAAFINTSIKQKGLVHCVTISGCKMLLFGSELSDNLVEVKEDLENSGIMLYVEGEPVSFASHANPEVENASDATPPKSLREGIDFMTTFGYIYTSGTTGLPKAAIILHQKMFMFAGLMQYGFEVKPSDTVYTCLPLFHSAGGGLGAGMMFVIGCTLAIKRKFSASSFWKDCKRYNATVGQYIGELCRYLVLQPPSEADRKHNLRIMIGNGLRPEIWNEFQQRFNIPEIGEFYGATEGNSALVNHCKTKDAQGTCGRMGALLMRAQGLKLVKFDVVTEEPVRDSNGWCIDCAPNEPGELLFTINPKDPGTKFAGYSDKKATEKKVLRNAFKTGDEFFRTGDLLSRDEKGYFRFVDRIGDTFRWKGENCSTTEVTEVVANFEGIEEVNVYGVQIPNNMDGRAPTAGITPTGGDFSKLDLGKLAQHVKKNLPSYAVPQFLRILPQMEVTATMKHQKVQLRTDGVDPEKVSDKLFWMNPATGTYEPFTQKEWQDVTSMKAKL